MLHFRSFVACAFLVSVVAIAPRGFAQRIEIVGPNAGSGAVKIEIDRIDAKVEEGVANVTVDETFRNTTGQVLEGVYRFQLPEDAVIGAFSMWMGGVEKRGRVLEAAKARQTYDAIVRKQKDPGLLEQVGWREFRVNVYPIPKFDTVRVKLEYSHVVRDDLALQTLEIPLPTKCGAIGDLRVHVTVAAAHGLSGLDCPSHPQALLKVSAEQAEASFSADGATPAGPFVVRAIPRREGFDVALLADRASDASEGWFIARIVPKLAAPPAIPRDVAFVIDRSGSMQGKKIEQARAALLAGLDTLKPGDRFDVISFSSDVTSLGEGRWLEVTAENLARARRAARDIAATGGTNIADALKTATRPRGADGAGRLAAVVFLTDGDPTVGETVPERILAAWRQESAGTRLFAFGVGNDVKDFLLTKLAVEGRGDARYVREDENLEVPLGALFERLRTPLLIDPQVEVESAGDTVAVLDREPRRLPDLFQGRALLVCGRYRGAGKAVLHLSGNSGGESISVDVPVEFPKTTPRRDFVAQIWAKTRVERLLDDLRVSGGNAEIKNEVLSLGLAHQLVTPYTSFLVVEDNVRLADGGAAPREGRAADEGTDPGRLPGVPTIGGGGDTTPPGNPGMPGPSAGGGRYGGPTSSTPPGVGGGINGPATGGSGAPATGAPYGIRGGSGGMTKRSSSECFERWEFWWEHNKDPFLAEDAAARAASAAPDAEIVATLLAALDDPDPDLADSAALALARMARGGDADGRVRAALTKTLHHPGRTAREAATLALGVLGRPESIPLLRELLGDTEAGRALTKTDDKVESMVRAFAAASLGMLRATEAAPDLKAVVQSRDSVDASLKQMALLALGMVPVGAGESADERVAFLLDRMVDPTSNDLVSAQAPIALCRLAQIDGAHAAAVHATLATRLLPALSDEHTSNDLRRSLAVAVGRIATIEDDDALQVLVATIQRAKDDQTRHFAIQALAEIGARDREPEQHAAEHALLKARLYEELAGSTHITHQPHAALALGVYFRNERLPAEARAGCVRRLAEVFDATTNPSWQGAIAVALGLLDAKGEADRLWKRFGESNDASLHGYIALALGLMGARDHARELRDEMRGGVRDAKYRIELAYGVGLQGDPADTKALIACMQAGATIAEAGAAARALGLARDPAARAPLLALARDAARPPLQRAFAEVALGLLLSREQQPWPAEFSVDSNYRAKLAALAEILDML
jgi:Ca-activated chloride channel family protein